ncbi:MAG TPA: hypothetical protein VF451_04680 [Acidobacteriota bacterium]
MKYGIFTILAIVLMVLPGCGGSVASGDLPTYPGAVELKAGSSAIGGTLAQNMKQDAGLRQAMGAGGKIEQRGFTLPAGATWDQVKGFYDKELKAGGWQSGLGGAAGSFVDINAVMGAANQGNDLFQTAMWSKGKQTLTVAVITGPIDKKERQLILSLSTQ